MSDETVHVERLGVTHYHHERYLYNERLSLATNPLSVAHEKLTTRDTRDVCPASTSIVSTALSTRRPQMLGFSPATSTFHRYLLYAFIGFYILLKFVQAASKNKYSVPPRVSWKGRLGNFLLAPLAFFQVTVFKPLSLPALKKMASKATKGLTCFGDTWYEQPYMQTMAMVNESTYSPIGKAAAHDFFLRRLIAKLRLNDHLENHACLAKPVNKPIFVVGLPRTGTTFLHRLLSLDPNARAPRTFELFDPVPRDEKNFEKDRKGRIRFVQKAIDQLETVVPHFSQVRNYDGRARPSPYPNPRPSDSRARR